VRLWAAGLMARPGRGEKQPPRHHAEILRPVGFGFQNPMMTQCLEARAVQQALNAVDGIEPLGIELVGDDAALVMDHNSRVMSLVPSLDKERSRQTK